MDELYQLRHIAYLDRGEVMIYNPIGHHDLWDLKTPTMQKRIEIMPGSSQVKDVMIYKLFGISCFPYIRPLSGKAAIVEGHVYISYGKVKKT